MLNLLPYNGSDLNRVQKSFIVQEKSIPKMRGICPSGPVLNADSFPRFRSIVVLFSVHFLFLVVPIGFGLRPDGGCVETDEWRTRQPEVAKMACV